MISDLNQILLDRIQQQGVNANEAFALLAGLLTT
jgi:hypothetical protein